MDPTQTIPEFVAPSMGSTAAFVAIVMGLCAGFVWAIHRAEPAWTLRAAAGTTLWLAITGLLSASGVLEAPTAIPPAMGFIGSSVLVVLAIALSPVGKRLSEATPLVVLIGFQAFRVPLEVILHVWYEQGTMPQQMTWEGANIDVVSGLAALVYLIWWSLREPPVAVAWAANVLGLALLLNVMRVAVTSTPIFLRTYMNDPPVLLAYHFPYSWIVPFCVAGALLGHILTFRALLRR